MLDSWRNGRFVTLDPVQVDNRKDMLLLLLAARDGEPVVGVTRMQKYLFLLQQQHAWDRRFRFSEPYQFRAYDYGPFDSQVYDDLQFFENLDFIKAEPAGPEPASERDELRGATDDWGLADPEVRPWEEASSVFRFALTDKGLEFARRIQLSDEDRQTLEDLKSHWNKRPLRDLLKWLYSEFPKYAENTKLRHLKA
jgi:hypothetical protein